MSMAEDYDINVRGSTWAIGCQSYSDSSETDTEAEDNNGILMDRVRSESLATQLEIEAQRHSALQRQFHGGNKRNRYSRAILERRYERKEAKPTTYPPNKCCCTKLRCSSKYMHKHVSNARRLLWETRCTREDRRQLLTSCMTVIQTSAFANPPDTDASDGTSVDEAAASHATHKRCYYLDFPYNYNGFDWFRDDGLQVGLGMQNNVRVCGSYFRWFWQVSTNMLYQPSMPKKRLRAGDSVLHLYVSTIILIVMQLHLLNY